MTVYLDRDFIDQVAQRLPGDAADYALAYLIGHAMGQHIQDLVGTTDLVQEARSNSGPALSAKTWMTAELADCLRRHNAVWVLPDQAWMPSPLSVVERLDAVTGLFAYFRLLGDRAAVDALTPTLDHIVIDRSRQVADDAQAISILRQRVPVVAFVNNHYAGYAPETARQLVTLTG